MENLLNKLSDNALDKRVKKVVENYLNSEYESDLLGYVLNTTSYVDETTYKVVRDYALLERVCNLLK
jgi:hypothetical protein